jgi:hypothetical protein
MHPRFLRHAPLRKNLRWQALASALNTPLAIWTLSAAFLSLGSWAHAKWQELRQVASERLTAARRIDEEVSHRLWVGQSMLGDLSRTSFLESPRRIIHRKPEPEQVASVMRKLLAPPIEGLQLHSQFRDQGLLSLLAQLTSLADEASDLQVCLKSALERARYFAVLSSSAEPHIERATYNLRIVADHRWAVKLSELSVISVSSATSAAGNMRKTALAASAQAFLMQRGCEIPKTFD